jgi:hypothetical protein
LSYLQALTQSSWLREASGFGARDLSTNSRSTTTSGLQSSRSARCSHSFPLTNQNKMSAPRSLIRNTRINLDSRVRFPLKDSESVTFYSQSEKTGSVFICTIKAQGGCFNLPNRSTGALLLSAQSVPVHGEIFNLHIQNTGAALPCLINTIPYTSVFWIRIPIYIFFKHNILTNKRIRTRIRKNY